MDAPGDGLLVIVITIIAFLSSGIEQSVTKRNHDALSVTVKVFSYVPLMYLLVLLALAAFRYFRLRPDKSSDGPPSPLITPDDFSKTDE